MDWTLLHKYLSDECNPGEMQQVEDWLIADERNQKFLDSLEKIWDVEPIDEIKVDIKSSWSSFQKNMTDNQNKNQQKIADFKLRKLHQKPLNRRTNGRSIAIFFSAVAVVLFTLLFTWQISLVDEASQTSSKFIMEEIVTSKGQKTTFRLSDGTLVQLNAESKIEISGKFMDSTRRVYLEGEAYFEVAHNSEKPFLVIANGILTRVIGTKFGVRAYPEEKQVQVIVTEGKVALGSKEGMSSRNNKEITKNQIGIVSENGKANVSNVIDIQPYLGWKEGKLVFDNTSFSKVIPLLERWYNITCNVEDSILDNRQITASFNGEPMTEVLNVIALSMGMVYEREGRNITFKKNIGN